MENYDKTWKQDRFASAMSIDEIVDDGCLIVKGEILKGHLKIGDEVMIANQESIMSSNIITDIQIGGYTVKSATIGDTVVVYLSRIIQEYDLDLSIGKMLLKHSREWQADTARFDDMRESIAELMAKNQRANEINTKCLKLIEANRWDELGSVDPWKSYYQLQLLDVKFQLNIERVDSSTTEGTVIEGVVRKGSIDVGDKIYIIQLADIQNPIKYVEHVKESVVVKIEFSPETPPPFQRGDNLTIHLSGVKESDITNENILVTPSDGKVVHLGEKGAIKFKILADIMDGFSQDRYVAENHEDYTNAHVTALSELSKVLYSQPFMQENSDSDEMEEMKDFLEPLFSPFLNPEEITIPDEIVNGTMTKEEFDEMKEKLLKS